MSHINILIVEDDQQIIKLLQHTFEEEGWQIDVAMDGAKALKSVEEDNPDLVILDLLLPTIDGFEVCQRIREWSTVPIIILSALGEPSNKVKCLSLGADDYVTKPFRTDELLARMKAVLRRGQKVSYKETQPRFSRGDLKIDFGKRRVTLAGNEMRLTPTEYNLLYELVLNKGKVLTYSHLLNEVWGPEYVAERDYLHVYIRHLRTKIEPCPATPRYIITVSGVGYTFSNT